MQVSESSLHHRFVTDIRSLEADLKQATSTTGENKTHDLNDIQQRLDAAAQHYQYADSLGTARYKLYELQALIHYFSGNDDNALIFIEQAETMKESAYPRAEKLRNQILDNPHDSQTYKTTHKQKLVGLEGWLALFTVGLGIGAAINIFELLGYPAAFNDIMSVQSDAPGFVSSITPVLWFEILQFIMLISAAIYIIVLLAKHRQQAKIAAIIFLVAAPILGIIDYAWASSIFSTYNLDVDKELSKEAGNIGRSIFAAIIWIPYFLISKRVKATLTK